MSSILITYSPHSTIILSEEDEMIEIYVSPDNNFITAIRKFQLDKSILCDSRYIYDILTDNKIKSTIDIIHPVLQKWRKNRFELLLEKSGNIRDYKEYIEITRREAFKETRKVIKQSAGKRDELAAQIIHAIDDMQKSYNLAANRISELYSLHFPELVSIITNPTTLARIISTQSTRESIKETELLSLGLPDDKIKSILISAKDSLGGELSANDLIPMQTYARGLITMEAQLRELEKWIDSEMEEIAPNLTAVAGANVGARLISAFGSLRQLAMKSSSKIQTVGAEKALYAALRGKGSPPKHGIIFQIPEVGNSPFWLRGKIARAFAGKIAIAARLDEFNGEFLGDKLRIGLREYESKIRTQFPNPPIPKKTLKKSKIHPAQRRRKNKK